MTIQHVIDTLDEFRDEYNMSRDHDVKKLCGFITNTIESLHGYLGFFTHEKSQIERSQQYYEGALETINKLLLEENPDETPVDPEPVPDTEDDFSEESGFTLEDIVNATEG